MLIRAKVLIAGPTGVIQPGDKADLIPKFAIPLIEGGYAESLDAPERRPTETEVIEPPETAVNRSPRKSRGR